MSVALPVPPVRKIIKALTKAGFSVQGTKGSHAKLKKANGKVFVVIVPIHPEVAGGPIKAILRQANLTREEFSELV